MTPRGNAQEYATYRMKMQLAGEHFFFGRGGEDRRTGRLPRSEGVFAQDPPTVDRVELVCLEHLDVGFTAAPQEIARRQKEHLDHAIELCLERPDFRWTVESIWQLEEWLARTPGAAERRQLVELVEQGRIEVAGGFGNLHTGVMDAALLLRSFEPARAIEAGLGLEITTCVQDDVPGFSALLPTAMAGSGIRRFLAGVNTTFGGGTSLGPGMNPFWWEGLDGSRVLTWVAYGSYTEAEQVGLGVWSRDGEAETRLPQALAQLSASGYAFDRVLVMASTGDNGDPFAARSILRKVDAWNAAHTRPRIAFTTPGAFLADLERAAVAATGRPDGGFPVARGDWSGHWEPVKATSPAGTALFREAQALLAGAEALSLRASRELGVPYPRHDLDSALRRLLLCAEHTRPGGVGWPELTTKADVEAAAWFDFEQAHGAAETLRGIVARVTEAYAARLAADGAAQAIANPSAVAQEFAAIEVPPFSFARAPLAAGAAADPPEEGRAGPELAWLTPLPAGSELRDAPAGLPRIERLAPAAGRAAWRVVIDLGAPALAAEPHDPLRLLLAFPGLELPSDRAAPPADRPRLSWTTAAGVISDERFLPGSLPLTRCTTGALRLEATPGDDGPDRAAVEEILLTREAFGFQVGEPQWLGAAGAAGAIRLHLLDRAHEGVTRDRGAVRFERVEPALDDLRAFHVARVRSAVDPAEPRWRRDAALVRAAAAWRVPLFSREFRPWFPAAPDDVGSHPLIEGGAENVLVLQCREARTGDRSDVILQLQEVGGAPATSVEITLALPGCATARACDLLERPLERAPRPAKPLRLDLRPHEVATFRFSDR